MNFLTRLLRGGAKPSTAVGVPEQKVQYLRPERTGILAMRRAVTRDGKVNVFEAAERASALAWDFLQNSGWIAGAANQIIVDTIGTELKLNARPELSGLGYDEKERSEWCREVEARWRRWAWTPRECDLAGKATIAEMTDGVARGYLASGESFGIVSFLEARDRALYGLETGTKVNLVASHRLPRVTREFEGLEQGIFQDANGRPLVYRFKRRSTGLDEDYDVPAYDGVGLAQVLHMMDRGDVPDSPRGISPMAPILKVIAQSDQLADTTLASALLRAVFAATIESPEPSDEAFQAIRTLADDFKGTPGIEGLVEDLIDVWGQRIDALKGGGINLAEPGRVAHVGPGEKLTFHTPETAGDNYLPFSQNLQREMARCLGITYESLTLDHSSATYSSVRMGNSTIWPLAMRRRERIAAPFCQGVYEAWLDEEIASGRIGFKGGYRAFAANRSKVTWAEWQGPAKPSADDNKAAAAAKMRLESGVSSLADECAELGRDWEEVAAQRAREQEVLRELGLPNPFVPAKAMAAETGDGQRQSEAA